MCSQLLIFSIQPYNEALRILSFECGTNVRHWWHMPHLSSLEAEAGGGLRWAWSTELVVGQPRKHRGAKEESQENYSTNLISGPIFPEYLCMVYSDKIQSDWLHLPFNVSFKALLKTHSYFPTTTLPAITSLLSHSILCFSSSPPLSPSRSRPS